MLESRGQQRRIVAVGPCQNPIQREAVTLDQQGAFHASLAPVDRRQSGALAAGRLGDVPVHGDVVQVQAQDAIVGLQHERLELGEHPGKPLVPAGPDRVRPTRRINVEVSTLRASSACQRASWPLAVRLILDRLLSAQCPCVAGGTAASGACCSDSPARPADRRTPSRAIALARLRHIAAGPVDGASAAVPAA